jgi:hypothetical protein
MNKNRQKAIEAGWNESLLEIGEELENELILAINNSFKKINNLKLNGEDAKSLISLAIVSIWSSWLCALLPTERANFFEVGTKLIAEDLMRKMQDELSTNKKN